MIKRGFGYSIMPYATVHVEASNGELGVMGIVEPSLKCDFAIAVNARRPLSAAVKAVRDIMIEVLRQIELELPASRPQLAGSAAVGLRLARAGKGRKKARRSPRKRR